MGADGVARAPLVHKRVPSKRNQLQIMIICDGRHQGTFGSFHTGKGAARSVSMEQGGKKEATPRQTNTHLHICGLYGWTYFSFPGLFFKPMEALMF